MSPTQVTPLDLMAGPRGRRLLLEFALASERAILGDAAEFPLGRAVFGATGGTAREVVRRLGEAPLGPVSLGILREALTRSVDSAMYWQEPQGEDLLCAVPEVREALTRVAEHVVSSAEVQCWTAPVDPTDQWHVGWADLGPLTAPDLAAWRAGMVADEAGAQRDRPTDPTARVSGMWWSRPSEEVLTSSGTFDGAEPKGLSLVEDSLGWTEATAHKIAVEGYPVVVEITGREVWGDLCRRFPLDVTALMRHDWYRTTGRVGRWVIPDWSRVAQEYAAAHLSIAGYLTAATTAVDVSDDTASVIAGCNPDTTWWFHGVVRRVGDPVLWVADDNDGHRRWTRGSGQ